LGVVNADGALHLPDFRAGERTFQLLTQVAGRAGRGDVPGEVIIQTFTPFHPAVQAARRFDFEGFCDQELAFRKELQYPPFSHLVCVTVRGAEEAVVARQCELLHRQLKPLTNEGVILADPAPAPMARVRRLYRYQFMLRSRAVRKTAASVRTALQELRWPSAVNYIVDVDALSLL
jgi:primosomal protein N' (replication factor Y)